MLLESSWRPCWLTGPRIWLSLPALAVLHHAAISDGVLSAYIPLLEVLPDYRGRGIGTRIVTMMLDSLDLYMVDLVCDDDLVPFYERLGLHRSSAMIRRRYDRQSGDPT